MLAWSYGIAKIMSSFVFDRNNTDQGHPLNDDKQNWVCEHKWRQIAHMVTFQNVTINEPVINWWDNQSNQIAFLRGSKGFTAINSDDF